VIDSDGKMKEGQDSVYFFMGISYPLSGSRELSNQIVQDFMNFSGLQEFHAEVSHKVYF
jgi:hypothetical protein